MNNPTFLMLILKLMWKQSKHNMMHVRLSRAFRTCLGRKVKWSSHKKWPNVWKLLWQERVLKYVIIQISFFSSFFFHFFLIKIISLVPAFIYPCILPVCAFYNLFVAVTVVDWNSQFVGLLEHVYSGDGTCTKQYTCVRQSHHISLHYHF